MTTETTSTAGTPETTRPLGPAGSAPPPAPAPPGTPAGGTPAGGTPAGGTPAGGTPAGGSRADRFREEISGLRITDPRSRLDAQLLRLGVLLMVVGVGLGIIGYFTSHTTTNPLQQRDAVDISLIGVSVTIGGAAFFLRYSLTGFLRFWLARLLFEQHERARRDG